MRNRRGLAWWLLVNGWSRSAGKRLLLAIRRRMMYGRWLVIGLLNSVGVICTRWVASIGRLLLIVTLVIVIVITLILRYSIVTSWRRMMITTSIASTLIVSSSAASITLLMMLVPSTMAVRW